MPIRSTGISLPHNSCSAHQWARRAIRNRMLGSTSRNRAGCGIVALSRRLWPGSRGVASRRQIGYRRGSLVRRRRRRAEGLSSPSDGGAERQFEVMEALSEGFGQAKRGSEPPCDLPMKRFNVRYKGTAQLRLLTLSTALPGFGPPFLFGIFVERQTLALALGHVALEVIAPAGLPPCRGLTPLTARVRFCRPGAEARALRPPSAFRRGRPRPGPFRPSFARRATLVRGCPATDRRILLA